jgi:hypothetical protein
MFFDLRFAESLVSEPDRIYFDGEGHDAVGQFFIRGSCNTLTGAIWASKVYRGMDSPHWNWSGMLTPFGRWGYGATMILGTADGGGYGHGSGVLGPMT